MTFSVGKRYFGAGWLMFTILVLLAPCGRKVSPPDNSPNDPNGVASFSACNAHEDCSKSGEICDFMLPQNSKKGTCLFACNPLEGSACSAGFVCSPISGACEQNSICSPSANTCAPIGSISPQCLNNNSYCGILSASGCPPGFKNSAGVCKIAPTLPTTLPESQTDFDYLCRGKGSKGLVYDPVTGTCEVGCSINPSAGAASCSVVNIALSATQSINFKCSENTSTCVQECPASAPQLACQYEKRTSCPTTLPAGGATCEEGCTMGSDKCGPNSVCNTTSSCAIACTTTARAYDAACPSGKRCETTCPTDMQCANNVCIKNPD